LISRVGWPRPERHRHAVACHHSVRFLFLRGNETFPVFYEETDQLHAFIKCFAHGGGVPRFLSSSQRLLSARSNSLFRKSIGLVFLCRGSAASVAQAAILGGEARLHPETGASLENQFLERRWSGQPSTTAPKPTAAVGLAEGPRTTAGDCPNQFLGRALFRQFFVGLPTRIESVANSTGDRRGHICA